MPVYVYNPDNPLANERGMALKEDDLYYRSLTSEDKRMMVGNEPVTIRFNTDGMEARSMFDGRMYTSKSKYRAEMRAHGCVEVGNDTSILKPRKRDMKGLTKRDRVEDIKKAIYQHTGKA